MTIAAITDSQNFDITPDPRVLGPPASTLAQT
jgi:hypothetical protein